MTTLPQGSKVLSGPAYDTYGLMQQYQRPTSAFTHKTEIPRPFSAYSRKSLKQSSKQISYQDRVEGVVKKGRGLGFFGDDNEKIKIHKENKEAEKNLKVKEFQAKTNNRGSAIFNSVPIGLYSIEVEGNEDYIASNRVVNIVNDEDKDELVIFVGLKSRNDKSI